VKEYKYPNFVTETAFEYKYQMATEIAEQNTSKQVSAKEMSQTSFGHISINSPSILTVLMATESP